MAVGPVRQTWFRDPNRGYRWTKGVMVDASGKGPENFPEGQVSSELPHADPSSGVNRKSQKDILADAEEARKERAEDIGQQLRPEYNQRGRR